MNIQRTEAAVRICEIEASLSTRFLQSTRRLVSASMILAALAAHAQDGTPDYSRIVEDVGASVVHIAVQRPGPPMADSGAPSALAGRESDSPPARDKRLLGSGFILTPDGYVVTAGSNMEQAGAVAITLSDGREFPAKAVGLDKRTDIALLKIDTTGLRPIRFADVLKLKTGQRVLLVGAAFPGTTTVADGIISHHSRTGFPASFGGQLIPYVATTAPVHPGNGGGALFDARGEVVAMVTQMYVSRSDPFATVTLAVPGDVIRFVTDSLRTRGYVSRGVIRITVQEVTQELAEVIGMTKPYGALVNATQPGGPADRAGIVAGDIILKFNGQPVTSSRDIPGFVANARPGTRIPVQVWKMRGKVTLTVEIEESEQGRSGAETDSR